MMTSFMKIMMPMVALAVLVLPVAQSASSLNVHLVPHSHCDAGWLLTAEQYYTHPWPKASINKTSGGPVSLALDTIVESLTLHPELRFVWAETIWLAKWVVQQTPEKIAAVQKLLDNGQLEIVGGGYVQNDEATTTFNDVIDQTTTGHEIIRRYFKGYRVKVGWQIDMFAGYSGVTPSLWALMGYEVTSTIHCSCDEHRRILNHPQTMYIISYQAMVLRWEGYAYNRTQWESQRAFEVVWHASPSLSYNESAIFAHIIDGNYGEVMEQGFDWESPAHSSNPPITPDNIANRSAVLVQYLRQKAESYQGTNVMFPWGGDFRFHNAYAQFGNMSLVVGYINKQSSICRQGSALCEPLYDGFTVSFSTMRQYLDALYAEQLEFPLFREQDFEFGWPHLVSGAYKQNMTYQTGAPTTWPRYKQVLRETDALARAAEFVLTTAAALEGRVPLDEELDALSNMRRARGLVQHHDSVPGTMRTNVSNNASFFLGAADTKADYEQHMDSARSDSRRMIASVLGSIALGKTGTPPPLMVLNSSQPLPAKQMTVLVYNSLSFARDTVASLLLPTSMHVHVRAGLVSVRISDASGATVPSQLDGSSVVFLAKQVPALGFGAYGVVVEAVGSEPCADGCATVRTVAFNNHVHAGADNVYLSNQFVNATVSTQTHALQAIDDLVSHVSVQTKHEMMAYFNGTGAAYILFELESARALPAPTSGALYTGAVFAQYCARYELSTSGVRSVCYRVYNTSDALLGGIVEVFHDLGPALMETEIISRVTTNLNAEIKHHGTMTWSYANDDSGLEMHTRAVNLSLTVAGNYRPMVSSAFMQSIPLVEPAEFAMISAHTMGVTSVAKGVLEAMLMRRTNHTDDQGPNPLDDTARLQVALWFAAGSTLRVEGVRPKLVLMRNHPGVVLVSPLSLSSWVAAKLLTSFAPLSAVPYQVEVQTFEVRNVTRSPNSDFQYVLRLRHVFEKGAHPKYSQPTQVDLNSLFSSRSSWNDVREKTLSLLVDSDHADRRMWKTSGSPPTSDDDGGGDDDDDEVDVRTGGGNVVHLSPVQIKTFTMH